MKIREYLALIAGGLFLSTSCYFAGKINKTLEQRKSLETNVVNNSQIKGRIFPEGYLERVLNEKKQETKKSQKKSKQKIIILDPGHGVNNRKKEIYDPGAVSEKYKEEEIVLNQAKIIKRFLEKKGYKVILTRENRNGIYYKDRPGLVKKYNADIYVSLHCNASEHASAHGQEIFGYKDSEDSRLANEISKEMQKELKQNFHYRGTKDRKLAVLTRTRELPSVLIESGFITNPQDRKYLTDKNPDVETAIADGIDDYLKSQK
ncbi:hypothetical protein DRN73_08980 [Candidatus Pacearchaeota archaeon]|nr:MAG: hypothetical protein DRN73_08980 [Candidatus Pacearchaeota archaeon]